MVRSMTGFGRSMEETNDYQIIVEMKSVNHRFSEFSIRMPRQYLQLEDKIKKLMQKYIHRGRVELYITVKGESLVKRSLLVDWPLADQYVETIRQMQERYHLNDALKLEYLLHQADLFDIQEENSENDEVEQFILKAVEQAATKLLEMRKQEGQELKQDLLSRLKVMNKLIDQIKQQAPLVVEAYKDRINKRIAEFLSGNIDENRILTEVAIFADKADISEELTRLKSHILQFEETLQKNEPIGRKLDFIVQEMNRETNTIGAKGNDQHIAKFVVELKSNIEKMKEQVQNIE